MESVSLGIEIPDLFSCFDFTDGLGAQLKYRAMLTAPTVTKLTPAPPPSSRPGRRRGWPATAKPAHSSLVDMDPPPLPLLPRPAAFYEEEAGEHDAMLAAADPPASPSLYFVEEKKPALPQYDTLTEEDAQALAALLTVPAVALAPLLRFFCGRRLPALLSPQLCGLLEERMQVALAFGSPASVEPALPEPKGASAQQPPEGWLSYYAAWTQCGAAGGGNRCAAGGVGGSVGSSAAWLAAADAGLGACAQVPVRPVDARSLGSPAGALLAELLHAPAAVLAPLRTLLAGVAAECSGELGGSGGGRHESPWTPPALLLARITARALAAAAEVLRALSRACAPPPGAHAALTMEVTATWEAASATLLPYLRSWAAAKTSRPQSGEAGLQLAARFHAHIALLLSAAPTSVLTGSSSAANSAPPHGFGAYSEFIASTLLVLRWAPTSCIWRGSFAPTCLDDSKHPASFLESSYGRISGTVAFIPTAEVVSAWHRHRGALLCWLDGLRSSDSSGAIAASDAAATPMGNSPTLAGESFSRVLCDAVNAAKLLPAPIAGVSWRPIAGAGDLATVVAESPHPTPCVDGDAYYRLSIPGARNLILQGDAQASLPDGHVLRLCADPSFAAAVVTLSSSEEARDRALWPGDTVYIHHSFRKRNAGWGFRLTASAPVCVDTTARLVAGGWPAIFEAAAAFSPREALPPPPSPSELATLPPLSAAAATKALAATANNERGAAAWLAAHWTSLSCSRGVNMGDSLIRGIFASDGGLVLDLQLARLSISMTASGSSGSTAATSILPFVFDYDAAVGRARTLKDLLKKTSSDEQAAGWAPVQRGSVLLCARLPPRVFCSPLITSRDGAAYRIDVWRDLHNEPHHSVHRDSGSLLCAAAQPGSLYEEIDGNYACHDMPRVVRLMPAALEGAPGDDALNAALTLGSSTSALIFDGALYRRAVTRAHRGDGDVHLLDDSLARLLRAALLEDLGVGIRRSAFARECHVWLRDGDPVGVFDESSRVRLLILVKAAGVRSFVEVIAASHPTPATSAGYMTGQSGTHGAPLSLLVQAFELLEHARTTQRLLVYSSDYRVALRELPFKRSGSSMQLLKRPDFAPGAVFCAGAILGQLGAFGEFGVDLHASGEDIQAHGHSKAAVPLSNVVMGSLRYDDSARITRKFGTSGIEEQLLPPRFLAGLLPEALVTRFVWWQQLPPAEGKDASAASATDAGLFVTAASAPASGVCIVGYAVKQGSEALSQGTVPPAQGEIAPDGTLLLTVSDARAPDALREAAVLASCAAGLGCEPQGLELEPRLTLVDVSRARAAARGAEGARARLATLFQALDAASHMLVWGRRYRRRTGADAQPAFWEGVWLEFAELPRLKESFSLRVEAGGTYIRLLSNDHAGLEVPRSLSAAEARLCAELPRGLPLRSPTGAAMLVAPALAVQRPVVGAQPFHRVLLPRFTPSFYASQSRVVTYSLHASGYYAAAGPALPRALQAVFLLLDRQYVRAAAAVRICADAEEPSSDLLALVENSLYLDPSEGNGGAVDAHPDAIAVRLGLFALLVRALSHSNETAAEFGFYAEETARPTPFFLLCQGSKVRAAGKLSRLPKFVFPDYASYLDILDHVSSACRLTAEDEKIIVACIFSCNAPAKPPPKASALPYEHSAWANWGGQDMTLLLQRDAVLLGAQLAPATVLVRQRARISAGRWLAEARRSLPEVVARIASPHGATDQSGSLLRPESFGAVATHLHSSGRWHSGVAPTAAPPMLLAGRPALEDLATVFHAHKATYQWSEHGKANSRLAPAVRRAWGSEWSPLFCEFYAPLCGDVLRLVCAAPPMALPNVALALLAPSHHEAEYGSALALADPLCDRKRSLALASQQLQSFIAHSMRARWGARGGSYDASMAVIGAPVKESNSEDEGEAQDMNNRCYSNARKLEIKLRARQKVLVTAANRARKAAVKVSGAAPKKKAGQHHAYDDTDSETSCSEEEDAVKVPASVSEHANMRAASPPLQTSLPRPPPPHHTHTHTTGMFQGKIPVPLLFMPEEAVLVALARGAELDIAAAVAAHEENVARAAAAAARGATVAPRAAPLARPFLAELPPLAEVLACSRSSSGRNGSAWQRLLAVVEKVAAHEEGRAGDALQCRSFLHAPSLLVAGAEALSDEDGGSAGCADCTTDALTMASPMSMAEEGGADAPAATQSPRAPEEGCLIASPNVESIPGVMNAADSSKPQPAVSGEAPSEPVASRVAVPKSMPFVPQIGRAWLALSDAPSLCGLRGISGIAAPPEPVEIASRPQSRSAELKTDAPLRLICCCGSGNGAAAAAALVAPLADLCAVQQFAVVTAAANAAAAADQEEGDAAQGDSLQAHLDALRAIPGSYISTANYTAAAAVGGYEGGSDEVDATDLLSPRSTVFSALAGLLRADRAHLSEPLGGDELLALRAAAALAVSLQASLLDAAAGFTTMARALESQLCGSVAAAENAVQNSSGASRLLLERAGEAETLSWPTLCAAALSSAGVSVVRTAVPTLQAPYIEQYLLPGALRAMMLHVNAAHAGAAIPLVTRTSSLIEELLGAQRGGPPAPGTVAALAHQLRALRTRLQARRTHVETLQSCAACSSRSSDSGIATQSLAVDPRFIYAEFSMSSLLRPNQVALTREFLAASAADTSTGSASRVRQLLMGEGKTAVISPLLAACLADGQTLVSLVMPEHLLVQSRETLAAMLRTPIVCKSLAVLSMTRGIGAYAPQLDGSGKAVTANGQESIHWAINYYKGRLINPAWAEPGFTLSDELLLGATRDELSSYSYYAAFRDTALAADADGVPLPACLLPRFRAHLSDMYCGGVGAVPAACAPAWVLEENRAAPVPLLAATGSPTDDGLARVVERLRASLGSEAPIVWAPHRLQAPMQPSSLLKQHASLSSVASMSVSPPLFTLPLAFIYIQFSSPPPPPSLDLIFVCCRQQSLTLETWAVCFVRALKASRHSCCATLTSSRAKNI